MNFVGLDELLAIQDVSIRNNARNNITGILLYTEGRFVQFLEGEQSAVRELYETIRQDDRHKQVRLLYHRPAGERLFEQWHLAMLDLELHSEVKQSEFWALIEYASDGAVDPRGQPKDLLILDRFAQMLSDPLDAI